MPASSPPQRGTVLVADDDPVMRLLMLEMLAQVGLDAIEAADGLEAVELAASRNPDLTQDWWRRCSPLSNPYLRPRRRLKHPLASDTAPCVSRRR